MGILFTLLLGTLFIRPAEIIPDLQAWPIFYVLIIGCTLVNLHLILGKLSSSSLKLEPTNAFVLILGPAVVLSHLANLRTIEAREAISNFSKVLVFYFVFVSVVTTRERLESLTKVLSYFITIAIAITVCQYLGYINLPGMESVYDNYTNPETGLVERVLRICGTGLFSDPNDLSLLLVLGMGLAVYHFLGARKGQIQPIWLLHLALYLYCLTLTHSRGGFLAMMVGMMVLFQARYGWKKAVPILLVAVPVAVVLFGGRQTAIDTSSGTGQDRIKLWALGFTEFWRHPIFGHGYDTYADITSGLHAHNSFVHAFVELGLFGGIPFFGCFWYVISNLYKLREREDEFEDPGLKSLRPCLLAALVASITGMMTVSRSYIMPTYLLVGMGMMFLRIADEEIPGAAPPLDAKTWKSVTKASLIFLVIIYTYARMGARFGGG